MAVPAPSLPGWSRQPTMPMAMTPFTHNLEDVDKVAQLNKAVRERKEREQLKFASYRLTQKKNQLKLPLCHHAQLPQARKFRAQSASPSRPSSRSLQRSESTLFGEPSAVGGSMSPSSELRINGKLVMMIGTNTGELVYYDEDTNEFVEVVDKAVLELLERQRAMKVIQEQTAKSALHEMQLHHGLQQEAEKFVEQQKDKHSSFGLINFSVEPFKLEERKRVAREIVHGIKSDIITAVGEIWIDEIEGASSTWDDEDDIAASPLSAAVMRDVDNEAMRKSELELRAAERTNSAPPLEPMTILKVPPSAAAPISLAVANYRDLQRLLSPFAETSKDRHAFTAYVRVCSAFKLLMEDIYTSQTFMTQNYHDQSGVGPLDDVSCLDISVKIDIPKNMRMTKERGATLLQCKPSNTVAQVMDMIRKHNWVRDDLLLEDCRLEYNGVILDGEKFHWSLVRNSIRDNSKLEFKKGNRKVQRE